MKGEGINRIPPEKRLAIQRSGGLSLARDHQYMIKIARRGGLKTSQDREHMRLIGSRGGKNRWKNK